VDVLTKSNCFFIPATAPWARAKAVNGSIIKLLFLVHNYPAADLSVFAYKLVRTWLVILLRGTADQHHLCLGIGPRVFSRDKLVKHDV